MAEVDLKELGIIQEQEWWEPLLNIGMILAALFQAVCLGFALFGPDSSSDQSKIGLQEKKSSIIGTPGRKDSSSPTEHGSHRRRSKQEKKKR